jgi:hypothetical protein
MQARHLIGRSVTFPRVLRAAFKRLLPRRQFDAALGVALIG